MFSLYLRSKERISFFRVLGSRVSMGWDFDKDWDFSIASRRERSISSVVISPLEYGGVGEVASRFRLGLWLRAVAVSMVV